MLVNEGGKVVIGDILDDEGKALAAEIGDSARYVHSTSPSPTSGRPRSTPPSASSANSTCW